jgi:hypothetical protein
MVLPLIVVFCSISVQRASFSLGSKLVNLASKFGRNFITEDLKVSYASGFFCFKSKLIANKTSGFSRADSIESISDFNNLSCSSVLVSLN